MNDYSGQPATKMPLVQVAWVVRDLHKAMSEWINLGIGPFFAFDADNVPVTYRGTPSSLSMAVGLAQAGPVQIELIQQTSDAPSAYTEVDSSGASQFHHICRAHGGYDEGVAKLRAQGLELVTEGEWGGTRFCYFDARATLGSFIEFVDDSPVGQKMTKIVREAADGWNGEDPIRDLAPLLG